MSFGVRHDDLVAHRVIEPTTTITYIPEQAANRPKKSEQLSNHIHKIWSYSRFRQRVLYNGLSKDVKSCMNAPTKDPVMENQIVPPIPREAYVRLKPALRLATIMLQRSLYFLYVVRNAAIIKSNVPGPNGPRVRKHFVRSTFAEFTESQKEIILQQPDELVKRYYIIGTCYSKHMDCIAVTMQYSHNITRPIRPGTNGGKQSTTVEEQTENLPVHLLPLCVTHSRTNSFKTSTESSPSANGQRDNGRSRYSILTCMPKEAMTLLSATYPVSADVNHQKPETIDLWPVLSKGAQDRVLLMLAVAFVHELVHALFYDRDADHLHCDDEVYFDPDNDAKNELGFAWEKWMFGGILHSVDGEVCGGGRDVAYVRYKNILPASKAKAIGRTRSQTMAAQPGILVTLPTYAIAWKVWRHTRSVVLSLGNDNRQSWFLDRDAASKFFNKRYLKLWMKPTKRRKGKEPSSQNKLDAITLSLRPIASRFPIPYWRGRDHENRDSHLRQRAWNKYDSFLERMYTTGTVLAMDSDVSDPWQYFDRLSEYSDSSSSPKNGSGSGTGTGSGDGRGSGEKLSNDSWLDRLNWQNDDYYAAEYGADGEGSVGAPDSPLDTSQSGSSKAVGFSRRTAHKARGMPKKRRRLLRSNTGEAFVLGQARGKRRKM